MGTVRSFKSTNVYFFTATILCWLNVLEDDERKNIIISSLRFLCDEKRIRILGFVIMPNHIHLIWQIIHPHKKSSVQRDFLKFTAQKIKFNLQDNNSLILDDLLVWNKDRMFQIWERNSYSFELDNPQTSLQKLNYIHNNPLQEKWDLVSCPEEYYYSSANYYKTERDDFGFMTHISEIF